MMSEAGSSARRCRLGLVLVLTLGCLGAAPIAAQGADDPRQVQTEVAAALEGYVKAVNAGDWDAVVEFCAADPEFFWIEDGAVRYRSKEDVAEAFAGLDGVFEALELRFDEVRVVPLAAGVASAGLLFHQLMTTAAGTSFEIEGAILATMVKRDGAWRFLSGHSSSRQPRPGPSGSETVDEPEG